MPTGQRKRESPEQEDKVGKGKLYHFSDSQFIGDISYQLFQNPAATNWWGELILLDGVRLNEGDAFIIELEDNRWSKCHLKKKVNRAVSGIPARYVYHVTGFSPIEEPLTPSAEAR
jgi:hypothetical protein